MNPTTESRLWNLITSSNLTASHEMIEEHRGIVLNLARKYVNGGGQEQYNELIGEGHLALCQACNDFPKMSRSCRFSSFSYNYIRRAIINFVRTDAPVCRPESESKRRALVIKNTAFLEKHRNFIEKELCRPLEDSDYERTFGSKNYVQHEFVDIDQCNLSYTSPTFFSLSRATKILVEELSSGATLGQLAGEWGCSREQLIVSLEPVLQELAE